MNTAFSKLVTSLAFLFGLIPSIYAQVNGDFSRLVPTYGTRHLYVSPQGDDLNPGTTVSRPFRTLQRAADMSAPGDSVWVMNGIYTTPGPASTVLFITKSGTPIKWIRFRAYPGHKPIVRVEQNWGGITVAGARYIEINGIEVEGNRKEVSLKYAKSQSENLNNPITAGNGISITKEAEIVPHHIIIRNCHVFDCCGGGIATECSDYVRIEGNLVHHNAFFSPYSQSGISMYLNANSDSFTGIKMIVRNNISYANFNYIPSYFSGATAQNRIIADGNGIIIDDTRNVNNSSLTLPYLGKTLVDNNLVYDNGGRGILAYLSDNVLISNNVCTANSRYHQNRSEMLVNQCSGIDIWRNTVAPFGNRSPLEILDSTDIFVDD